MKLFTLILFLMISYSLGASETEIVYRSSSVKLPKNYIVTKKQSGDCPGLTLVVRPEVEGTRYELTLKVGDVCSALNFQLTKEELRDLEYFERDPNSWFGYMCVVTQRGDNRIVEVRYPIENVFIKATIPKDASYLAMISIMKKVKVGLAPGWKLTKFEENRSFILAPE